MDRVQRHYARTALQGTDPLQGLSHAERRAILTMPPSIGERLRLAPWRSLDTRRTAIREIIAERRLAYTLANESLDPTPAPSPSTGPQPLNAYYQHRAAMAHVMADRYQADIDILKHGPPAAIIDTRATWAPDLKTHTALLEIQLQRARLDIAELEIMNGHATPRTIAPPAPPPDALRLAAQKRKTKTKSKTKDRDR